MGESDSGLLYDGQFGQLNLLVTASYSWIFGLLFNACNFAMLEMVMRSFIKDEKTRVKTTCFLMQMVASLACLIIYIARWDSIFWAFKEDCRAPSLAACSDAMIVTAYIVEIGKKGKSMRWTLLLHHIATIAYSIYALDQYMGELLYAVGNAPTPTEAYELFYTEDVTSFVNSKHRANARLTIIFAQMQLIGAGLEAPTFFALAYQKFVGYFGQKKMPAWMPSEPAVLLFNFVWWLLNKAVLLPIGIIWLMVKYADEKSNIPLSYTVVLISGIILTSVSLWATYVMYLIYLKAKKRAHKARKSTVSAGDVQLKVIDDQRVSEPSEQSMRISPVRESKAESSTVRKASLLCLYTMISIVSFAFMLVLMSAN